jgi:hypothetical protein
MVKGDGYIYMNCQDKIQKVGEKKFTRYSACDGKVNVLIRSREESINVFETSL